MTIKLFLDFILRLLFFAVAVVQSYILSQTFVDYKFGILTGVFISIFMGIGMGLLSGYAIPFLIKSIFLKKASKNIEDENSSFRLLMKSKTYADAIFYSVFLIILTALAFRDYEYWRNAKQTTVSNLEMISDLREEYSIFEVENIAVNHETVGYYLYHNSKHDKKNSYHFLASPLKNSDNQVWIIESYNLFTDINEAFNKYNETIKKTNTSQLLTLKRDLFLDNSIEKTLESVGVKYSDAIVFVETLDSKEAEIEKAYIKLLYVLIFGIIIYVLMHLIILIRKIKGLYNKKKN